MNADQILVADLGLDALAYMKRVSGGIDMETAAQVAAAFTAGAPFELRVRMWARREPQFSVVQIRDSKEVEISSIGGGQ